MLDYVIILWSYFVPLLISFLFAFGLKQILRAKLDITFALSYMTFCLSTYLFTLCGGALTIGFILSGICIVVLGAVFCVKRKQACIMEHRDVEIAMAFVALYTIVFVFDFNRGFTHWDEMSHWGPMVKENLRLDELYSVAESKLQTHKDYPPIVALFETAWSKLCGGYSEKYLYRSLHMVIASMIFSMVTYFWDSSKNKLCSLFRCAMVCVPFVAVCTVLSLDDGDLLTTIYTDGALAVTAAFCFFLVLTLREYSREVIVIQAIALSFLMLVKQIGFEYFCLCYCLLVIIGLGDYKRGTERKRIVSKLLCLLVIPVFFERSWSLYVKVNELGRQFDVARFDFDIIKGVITGTDVTSWQYRGTLGYFDALYTRPLFMFGDHIISYIDLIIICTVIYVVLFVLQKKIKKNCYVLPMFAVYVVSMIGHIMMMWITYMFGYNENDFLELVCYERYMNIIWIANCIILVFLFWRVFGELFTANKKILLLFSGFVAVACIGVIALCETGTFLKPALENNSSLQEHYGEADFIVQNTEEDSSIFIVTQSYTGYFEYVFQYLTMPRSYNGSYYSLGEPYSEEDNWTRNITEEEFINILGDYDYMYFWDVDEQFTNNYGIAFENTQDIVFEDGYLYSICLKDNGGVELELKGAYE